jgi:hypothetical protein
MPWPVDANEGGSFPWRAAFAIFVSWIARHGPR